VGRVGWYCCSSYGLQTLQAPSALSLTPPIRSLCSVQCLAAIIPLCISQAMAEPFREQLYQTPDSMHFLASAVVQLVDCTWDGLPDREVSV